jgi:hypothetical protein
VETGTESGRRSGFCFGIHPEHAPTAAPFVNLPSVEMMHLQNLQTLAVGYPKASKPTPVVSTLLIWSPNEHSNIGILQP